MGLNKKKILIISGIIATIGIIITIIIVKGKKAIAASAPANQTSSTPVTGQYSFVNIFLENNSYTIQYEPLSTTFNVGDSIKIITGPSNIVGITTKIVGIKNFTSGGAIPGSGQNLYLDLDKSLLSSANTNTGTFNKI
jgi:hypothetical protein